jgi:hypothetical protein
MEGSKKVTYANLSCETQRSEGNNDVEMNNMQLTNEDPENPENRSFHIKTAANCKTVADFDDFKMKHCKRVRTVIHQGNKLTSIYHPKDDTHAFYINRNKDGNFDLNYNKNKSTKTETRKFQMVKEPLTHFINKINSVIAVEEISTQLKKLKMKKLGVLIGMCFLIFLLAYNFLNIILFFLSLVTGHSENLKSGAHGEEQHTDWQKFVVCLIFALTGLSVFILIRIYKKLHAREKYLFFVHIFNKKRSIEIEIEYFNNSILHPYNMKAILSDTLDYIQVFYDKSIVYEIDYHSF